MLTDECIDLLGRTVKDKITGGKGVVISVVFDLYGCIQVLATPGKLNNDGTLLPHIGGGWIDLMRVTVVKGKRKMDRPYFNNKYSGFKEVGGPAEKPGLEKTGFYSRNIIPS